MAVIVLVITVIIGFMAVKQFRKLPNLYKSLKYLFYLTIVAIISRCICIWFSHTICFCDSIVLFAYFVMAMALLGTLLFRLKYTFEMSAYALSINKQIAFWVLFVSTTFLFLVAWALSIVGFIQYEDIDRKKGTHILSVMTWIIGIIGLILYINNIITGTWAVLEFSYKLLALTEIQQCTVNDINKIQLNKSQRKLINQIAKYTGLFSLAAFVSILSTVSLGTILYISRNNDIKIIPIA
eukprot:218809_1